jgi:hypothetical protein
VAIEFGSPKNTHGNRRYETTNSVARDIKRFLHG